MASSSSFSFLAERLGLAYIAAVALPATVARAAGEAGVSAAEVLRACWDTPEIGAYIASICNLPDTRAEVEAILREKEVA